MSELHKEWLMELYKREIEECEGTISNERIWMNGSTTDEEISCHEGNINNYEEYIEILEGLIEDLEIS